jgi:hypothetical protein
LSNRKGGAVITTCEALMGLVSFEDTPAILETKLFPHDSLTAAGRIAV